MGKYGRPHLAFSWASCYSCYVFAFLIFFVFLFKKCQYKCNARKHFNNMLLHLLRRFAFQTHIQNRWTMSHGKIILQEAQTVIRYLGRYALFCWFHGCVSHAHSVSTAWVGFVERFSHFLNVLLYIFPDLIHTHNHFTALLGFVQDCPGEPAPERWNQSGFRLLEKQEIVSSSGISLDICKICIFPHLNVSFCFFSSILHLWFDVCSWFGRESILLLQQLRTEPSGRRQVSTGRHQCQAVYTCHIRLRRYHPGIKAQGQRLEWPGERKRRR